MGYTAEEVSKPDYVYAPKTPEAQASYERKANIHAGLISTTKELVMQQADALDEHIADLKMLSALFRKAAGNNFATCDDHIATSQLGERLQRSITGYVETHSIAAMMHALLDHGYDENEVKRSIAASCDRIKISRQPSMSIHDLLAAIFSR